ncbi:MAG: DNA translocase FtsK 4TM domain-containing protein, partial [Planctomycetia bacterium]
MAFVDRSLTPPFAPAARGPARPAAEPSVVVPRDRVRDLTALALLAACALVVVALATFDPADPPAARMFPPHARATNACGLFGSTIATGLYEAFGLGAWFVVGLALGFDVALLRRRAMPDLPLRAAGAVLATAGACTLLAMFLPDWVERPLWGAGGRTGALGRLFAEAYLARTGAAIVVSAVTAAGLFLACDAVLVRLARGLVAAGKAVITTFRSLAAGVAARRAARLPRAADDAVAATVAFPGLRRRSPFAPAADAEDDADEDDAEPTIRVRRRAPPTVATDEVEADEDEGVEEAEDSAVDADEVNAEDSTAAPAAAVPIRSLASRRRQPPPLELAPDPAADYELPDLDLLLPTEHLELDQQEQEVRERARVLEKTFAEFGFKVKVVEIETGPVISQYEIELEAGLRLAKITNLADDLAIALRVPSVRIVAPIPGKNSVGIEVPNTTRQMVRLREVIEETQAKSRSMKIPIYLGKDVAGNPMVVDMASLPHLLIAGRTGTGKSVCLNSIIVSMLMTRRPDEVRMLMIDPKMVELTPYKSLPHLMHPVVTDMKKAEAILAWAVEKMEERYTLLAKAGVRHLAQYNQLGRDALLKRIGPASDEEAALIPTTMPFIVMIADEIADMMMTAGKEIEQYIIRLAQK